MKKWRVDNVRGTATNFTVAFSIQQQSALDWGKAIVGVVYATIAFFVL